MDQLGLDELCIAELICKPLRPSPTPEPDGEKAAAVAAPSSSVALQEPPQPPQPLQPLELQRPNTTEALTGERKRILPVSVLCEETPLPLLELDWGKVVYITTPAAAEHALAKLECVSS
jgi:hypothetical protein